MNTERLQQKNYTEIGGSSRRLLWIVPVATLLATVANVIFYTILTRWFEEPLLMLDQFPPPEVVPMPVGEVILFSIIWALGASIVYSVLTATTARPERIFIIVSAAVLILSFILPLKIPTPPVTMTAKFSLMMMHVIGAIVVVGLLVVLGRNKHDTEVSNG